MQLIIATMFHKFRENVQFHFARRPVAQLPCLPFSRARQSPSQPPPPAQLAYLDLSEIAQHRRTKLAGPAPPMGARRRPNAPGFRRVQKQLRRLAPKDRREDPYLAALLIALAQEQRLHYSERRKGGEDDGNDTKLPRDAPSVAPCPMLLVTRPSDTRWLPIYTSNVSPEFLDRFDRPSHPPPADAPCGLQMAIHRRRLTFKPYETLQQRLAAVVRDANLVGEYGPKDLDKEL